ncbi:MAG: ABC transporter substrate-binding protein [Halobacteriales archaeon]|nr:ABC transporter substrate-binding protein [Halobacteriales archaeon]
MTDPTPTISRRGYLTGLGAGATTALAGCAGTFGGGGGPDSLTVAYMPIYPDMQHFVMQEEGYYDELAATVDAKQFSNGPAIVQAYASGELDVALFGVVPAMIVIDKGIAAKVVAANIEEAMAIMTHEEFRAHWDGADDAKGAFRSWADAKGRPFTFATFPPGSVPDILLRYWLVDTHGIDPDGFDAVEIKGPGGANAVFSALASGSADGTSIMEWVPTKVAQNGLPFEILATAGEFMPGQPAAVTLMNDDIRGTEVATQFVRQHQRATAFINANPDEAAQDAVSVIGQNSLEATTARQALDSPMANFITDPHAIEGGTAIFADFAHRFEKTGEELSIDQIFDFSVYDGL